MNVLQGKTIIVTGASLGIGSALALLLADEGVNLVLNARHASPLEQVASACIERGARVGQVVGSAAEAGVVSRLVELALSEGSFHGFIQVAGVLHPGPFTWELGEDQYREIFDASVVAGFQLIRLAVPRLLEQGGGLAVFFGSGAAERAIPGIGAYCAAKAAEEHLVRQLAAEAPEITSFIYRPGVVETRMQQTARIAEGGAAQSLRQAFKGFKERGELLSPEQAAGALVQILKSNPRRFHGKIATWRDGIGEQ